MDDCLDDIRASPADVGRVELIVCRPAAGARQVLDEAELDVRRGLVGDNWLRRPSSSTRDGKANPLKQITLMNARAAAAVAGDRARWPGAGDQLYVDLALGYDSLPPGSLLSIGSALIEVTEPPHRGCPKFTKQFGVNATRFVCSPEGLALNLRGVNARIAASGMVRVGDEIVLNRP